jgi:hypothetical protein
LEYRIEFFTDTEDDLSAAGDLDYLEVGCADIGTRLVRMWVISHPSNTRDYCDALLVVQSDLSGCDPQVAGNGDVMGYEEAMTHTNAGPVHTKMDGKNGDHQISGDAGLSPDLLIHEYLLEQNQPNPFQHETSIGFVLPESMIASLEVYDLTGRLLKSIKGSFSKGYNMINLEKKDLNTSGVLYYRLRAGEFLAMKKMILID